jgi:hypothetical protein
VDFSGKDVAEGAAALALVVAVIAGVIDWRQKKRDDLDRVTLLDWRSVQVFALIAAVIAFSLAMKLQ